MSLYTMTFLGAAPVGALIGGWLADQIGVKAVTLGSAALLGALGAYGLSPLPGRDRAGALANPGAPG
jgi:MFS family permease